MKLRDVSDGVRVRICRTGQEVVKASDGWGHWCVVTDEAGEHYQLNAQVSVEVIEGQQ